MLPGSPPPWSRWATRSASRWLPRASSRALRPTRSARWDASWARASCSPARWRSATYGSTSTKPVSRHRRGSGMQHSYDQLDRAGGYSWVNPLAPLRHRDFRRLWIGMTASLLGGGVFVVSMAWQVYELSNAPAALSMVGIAMTIPTIVLLLFGGVVSDRVERRRVLIGSDVLRGAAVAVMALLSLTGSLELWHMMVLVAVYGAGTAFFGPAFDAIVPDLLPASLLPQANSLDQFVRPLALRLAGPAVGGFLIAGVGVGWAFALNAATFAVSAAALLAMSPPARTTCTAGGSVVGDIRVGFAYVRRHVWLWGTFVSAAVAYL